MMKIVLLIGAVLLLGLLEVIFVQYAWHELVIEVFHANVEELSLWKSFLLVVVFDIIKRPSSSIKKKD